MYQLNLTRKNMSDPLTVEIMLPPFLFRYNFRIMIRLWEDFELYRSLHRQVSDPEMVIDLRKITNLFEYSEYSWLRLTEAC